MDYFLGIRGTFYLRNPTLSTDAEPVLPFFESLYKQWCVYISTFCHVFHQRSEVLHLHQGRITPLSQLGIGTGSECVLHINKSNQKSDKDGASHITDKMLTHNGCGEGCYPGGPTAWYACACDEDKPGAPGYCALCLHIHHQKLLDELYSTEHPQATRGSDPEAVIFPKMDVNTQTIYWREMFDATGSKPLDTCNLALTKFTRDFMRCANDQRPGAIKDVILYYSHSHKVGGAWELVCRNASIHEAQMVTGHAKATQVLEYCMLLQMKRKCDILHELQTPGLDITHQIFSTRVLYQKVLNAVDGFEEIRNEMVNVRKYYEDKMEQDRQLFALMLQEQKDKSQFMQRNYEAELHSMRMREAEKDQLLKDQYMAFQGLNNRLQHVLSRVEQVRHQLHCISCKSEQYLQLISTLFC